VPTDAEWNTLIGYLDPSFDPNAFGIQSSTAGGKIKSAGTQYWVSPNESVANESGFSGIPGGYRINSDVPFNGIGYYGHWWSYTESNIDYAWYRSLSYSYDDEFRYYSFKLDGFSVRCLRD
jgi:uncharacterized protein (TIGR02145 family)